MNEKGLSKDNNVSIKNFPSATTENNLGKVEELLKNKPDTLIVHVGINDFTKGKNVLNSVKKKLLNPQKYFLQTKLVFSSLIVREDKTNIIK